MTSCFSEEGWRAVSQALISRVFMGGFGPFFFSELELRSVDHRDAEAQRAFASVATVIISCDIPCVTNLVFRVLPGQQTENP